MKISKKALVLSVTYTVAAFFVLGGFFARCRHQLSDTRLLLSNTYSRALWETADAVGDMETALIKCQKLGNGGALSSCSQDLQTSALRARTAMAALPLSDETANRISRCFNQTADYGSYLSRVSAGAVEGSEKQPEDLARLQEAASSLSASLQSLISQWEERFPQQEELCRCLSRIDEELPLAEGLEYDGALSEKTTQTVSTSSVSDRDALSTLLRFTDTEESFWQAPEKRAGETPVLVFAGQDGSSAEISQSTGSLLFYRSGEEAAEGTMEKEDCLKAAAGYLEEMGFDGMENVGWEKDGGKLTLTFVYKENEVLCYPDKLLLSLSTEDGRVVGFQDMGYDTSHSGRTLPDTLPDPHSYDGHLCRGLTALSHGVAVISSPGNREILCCEYLCQDEKGNFCVIDYNPQTMQEEQIFLISENENGQKIK